MADISFPAKTPDTPGYPNSPYLLLFDTFAGLNTKPSRPALAPEECYILDNFMPLGKSNARTIYDIGPSIYAAPPGKTILYFWFYNIGSTPYMAALLNDGSVIQVVVATGATTTIAPAGTVLSPANQIGTSQWGSQYMMFCADQTNGYWVWDGTNLSTAGTLGPATTIYSSGLDYTSQPTITVYGGSGHGATYQAILRNGSIESFKLLTPGTGYSVTDQPILVFSGGGSSGRTATATVTVSAGVITAVHIVDGGAGYTSSASVLFLGGGGVGATGTVSVSGGAVTGVTVTHGGGGYGSNVAVFFSDSNNPVAAAYPDVMPFGVSGTCMETNGGHVWLGNGNSAGGVSDPQGRILFSAPGSVVDFNTTTGGGSFTSQDSFTKVGYFDLRQTNGFLYLLGDSSVNTISSVQTSYSSTTLTSTTTFINSNVDPQIGTSWARTVQSFGRNLVFANSFGVFVSYGGAVTRISAPLDGLYTLIPSLNGFVPSSALAAVFGIPIYILLLPIIDQVTGQRVNKLLMWDSKAWFTGSQSVQFTFIGTQEFDSVLTAYGTDGFNVYPLFQEPSVAITKTIQSKLSQDPGYWYTKTANRLVGLVNYYTAAGSQLNVAIDNETGTPAEYTLSPSLGALEWTNSLGGKISWTNSAHGAIVWGAQGIVAFPPFAVGQKGACIGVTLSTTCADMAVISLGVIGSQYKVNI